MFEDPLDIFEEMDEMVARLFSRMDRDFTPGSPHLPGYRILIRNGEEPSGTTAGPAMEPGMVREPVAEVHHIGDEVKVITELPGTDSEAIRLGVKGSRLVIDAGDGDHHYRTSADLPPVDATSMQKSFRNGVLEVTFRSLDGSPGT